MKPATSIDSLSVFSNDPPSIGEAEDREPLREAELPWRGVQRESSLEGQCALLATTASRLERDRDSSVSEGVVDEPGERLLLTCLDQCSSAMAK